MFRNNLHMVKYCNNIMFYCFSYEAWVIYNFLSLCLGWVGGPGAVVLSLSGRVLKPSWYLMTCCVPPIPLDGWVSYTTLHFQSSLCVILNYIHDFSFSTPYEKLEYNSNSCWEIISNSFTVLWRQIVYLNITSLDMFD